MYWIVLTCIMLTTNINARVINSNEIIDHRKVLQIDVVAACQMNCFEEFLFDEEVVVDPFWNIIDQCMERSNCYMCYDFCEMLHDESRMIGKLMCTNDTCVRILIYRLLGTRVLISKFFLFLIVYRMQTRLCLS